MGANAQTTVPTFTAGDVLTAAQMNQSARTGVPVFANTSDRDAAFGGTGEKTLAEGQLCYLEDANIVQYYDGSNWATVGPSTAAGMTLITTESFSAVTAVNVNTCFTTTYQNYRIILNTDDPTTNQTILLRLRVSGADNTNNSYYRINWGTNTGGGAGVTGQNTSWFIGYAGNSSRCTADFMMFSPNETVRTTFAGTGVSNNAAFNAVTGWAHAGWFDATTSFDGFSVIFTANTTGVVRVYGLLNS